MNASQPPSSAPNALTQDDRTWGMIAHFSALAMLLLWFVGGILGPLVVWVIKKDQSAFAAEAAKEALNFNITVALGFAVCGFLVVVFIGFLLGAALFIFWLVMTIIAGIKASEGVQYRYPISLRLVK